MYQYVFFDLDGTLTDSAPGIIRAVRYSLDKCGVKDPGDETLLQFIGPPLDDSYAEYCGMNSQQISDAMDYFHEYYDDFGCFENQPYPGICEVLDALQKAGLKNVLATSKPIATASKIMRHFDLDKYFVYLGAANGETRNGKAEVIEDTLKACGVQNPEEVLMVGDRRYDVAGAKANHLDSAAVLYGFGSREELEKAAPTYIIEKVGDIKNLLLTNTI